MTAYTSRLVPHTPGSFYTGWFSESWHTSWMFQVFTVLGMAPLCTKLCVSDVLLCACLTSHLLSITYMEHATVVSWAYYIIHDLIVWYLLLYVGVEDEWIILCNWCSGIVSFHRPSQVTRNVIPCNKASKIFWSRFRHDSCALVTPYTLPSLYHLLRQRECWHQMQLSPSCLIPKTCVIML